MLIMSHWNVINTHPPQVGTHSASRTHVAAVLKFLHDVHPEHGGHQLLDAGKFALSYTSNSKNLITGVCAHKKWKRVSAFYFTVHCFFPGKPGSLKEHMRGLYEQLVDEGAPQPIDHTFHTCPKLQQDTSMSMVRVRHHC